MFKLSFENIETLGTESENVKRCGSAFATTLNVRDLQRPWMRAAEFLQHQSKNRNSIDNLVGGLNPSEILVNWDDYSQYMA